MSGAVLTVVTTVARPILPKPFLRSRMKKLGLARTR